jgi:hypothetical protein
MVTVSGKFFLFRALFSCGSERTEITGVNEPKKKKRHCVFLYDCVSLMTLPWLYRNVFGLHYNEICGADSLSGNRSRGITRALGSGEPSSERHLVRDRQRQARAELGGVRGIRAFPEAASYAAAHVVLQTAPAGHFPSAT